MDELLGRTCVEMQTLQTALFCTMGGQVLIVRAGAKFILFLLAQPAFCNANDLTQNPQVPARQLVCPVDLSEQES